MIINNASLAATAVGPKQYPPPGLPEIAFLGRSNVGKSSLINSMLNRRSLARTSQTPGKTQTINFYEVEMELYFVDLPGYGYAKVSKSESKKWGAMIESYLAKRESLRAVTLLIDIRREPSENDVLMYDWLEYHGRRIIIAVTKTDKLSKNQAVKNLSAIKRKFGGANIIIPYSSHTGQGREELWGAIRELARPLA
jgi:GTP-binding protein